VISTALGLPRMCGNVATRLTIFYKQLLADRIKCCGAFIIYLSLTCWGWYRNHNEIQKSWDAMKHTEVLAATLMPYWRTNTETMHQQLLQLVIIIQEC